MHLIGKRYINVMLIILICIIGIFIILQYKISDNCSNNSDINTCNKHINCTWPIGMSDCLEHRFNFFTGVERDCVKLTCKDKEAGYIIYLKKFKIPEFYFKNYP